MADMSSIEIVLAVMILAAVVLIAIAYALFKRLINAMKLLAIGILTCTAITVLIIIAVAVYIFLM